VNMLHPIRETAHFMNLPLLLLTSWTCLYSCPLHELASTLAHFMNWPLLLPTSWTCLYSCPLHELASTLAHFMNWPLLLPISRTGRFFVHFLPTSWNRQICMLRLRLGCWPLHIFMHMMCKFVVPSSWTGQKMNKESPSSWNGQE
jgi:hypothetical protein